MPKMIKVEIDLDELRKEEVQNQLAELFDKILVFKGPAGILVETIDRVFFKTLIRSLVGQIDNP